MWSASFNGFLQVKLDLSCLQDIEDDMDFCCRLAKEELVVVLPGTVQYSTAQHSTVHPHHFRLNSSPLHHVGTTIYFPWQSKCHFLFEHSKFGGQLPGCAVGYKNWLRVTFAIGPSSLKDGLDRLKSFCLRHSKSKKVIWCDHNVPCKIRHLLSYQEPRSCQVQSKLLERFRTAIDSTRGDTLSCIKSMPSLSSASLSRLQFLL